MKFFTYDLIATANGWSDVSPAVEKAARTRFTRALAAYHRSLDRLRPRVSAAAWNFFRHGWAEEGLHDATLLTLAAGDELSAEGLRAPLWYRRIARTAVRLEFQNQDGRIVRAFECRGVRRLRADLFVEHPPGRNLGDLYTYELRTATKDHLALSFLFASGAEIEVEFRRLLFSTRRQNRSAAQQGIGPDERRPA
jgi:hypothetical protein